MGKKFFIILLWAFTIAVCATFVFHTTQRAYILCYQGKNFFKKKEYDKAIPLYVKSLEIDPHNVEAITGLAYAAVFSGKMDLGILELQKLVKIEPGDYTIKGFLAQVLSWNKHYPDSIKLYREIIAHSDDMIAKERLAELFLWAGNPEKAKILLETLIRKKPEDYKVRLLLGKSYLYTKDWEKARFIFESLLKTTIKEKHE